MYLSEDWIKQGNLNLPNSQINFIRKVDRLDGLPNLIILQKSPNVDIHTNKIIGYVYSVKTTKTHWKRFSTEETALIYVKKLM